MTKRQLAASPLSSRKRRVRKTPSSEDTGSQSVTSTESDHTPGLLPSISSGSRSPSPTKASSDIHISTPEKVFVVSTCTTSSSPLSSATASVTHTKDPDKNSEMLAPPSTSCAMMTKIGPAGLLTPEIRESIHNGTVSVQPCNGNALVHFQAPDAFPVFRTGDTVIKSELGSTPVTFQLHSAVLAQHSPWFKNSFQLHDIGGQQPTWWSFSIEDVGGKICLVQHHANGVCPAVLPAIQEPVVKVEDTSDDILSVKQSIEPPESGPSAVTVRRPKEPAVIGFYSQVFGAFYNITPSISTTDVGSALVLAEELVKLAGNLGCLHLIRPHLGNVLGQYRQKLFVAIKSDPPRWILLAHALENASIYQESFIHLVGAHPNWPWLTKRAVLHPELQQLIVRKSAVLDKMCTEAERDLLIATIRVGKDPVSPHERGNIDTWVVVQVFRDALARHLHSLGNSNGKKVKTRGTFFRGLSKGSYMDSEAVRGLCQEIMTSSWKELGDDLKTLKQYAADVVEELAENQLMIDPDANGVGYLTCTTIEPKDLPWQAEG